MMNSSDYFEDIRPYRDNEISSAFETMAKTAEFSRLVNFLYPGVAPEQIIAKLKSLTSILQFQTQIVVPYLDNLLEKTAKGLFNSGFEHVDSSKNYTYITNHRDIVLDSAFLNKILLENGLETTEIAIGDNLLIQDWIEHLVRINRSFIVKRNVPVRQQLEVSKKLSEYIRYALYENKHSVWVAQREGRSKDATDRTYEGVLKMLTLGGTKVWADNVCELNLLPVTISYEYDPCDYLKARELYLRSINEQFEKTQADDLFNMKTGMTGQKGRIHYAFTKPISHQELQEIDGSIQKNEKFTALARLIDNRIHSAYYLFPGNYVACAAINNQCENSGKFTPAEAEVFMKYIDSRVALVTEPNIDKSEIRRLLLTMYANPVVSKQNATH